MRMELYKIHHGSYKFSIKLDTGAETGADQLTVWYAEKVDSQALPLAQFRSEQLLKALKEPRRSYFLKRLEDEKNLCRKQLEDELLRLQQSEQAPEKKGKKRSGNKKQARQLREQIKDALQRLETEFVQREILTLARDCFDEGMLEAENQTFSEWRSVRDFYFEETGEQHIRAFCRQFALEEPFRQQALAGDTHWARRNQLFVRNLHSVLHEDPTYVHGSQVEHRAQEFFYWLDRHVEDILALPEYQRLQMVDSAFRPGAGIDPDIRPAVELLNQIPGVVTQFSCQGVSGKITFQNRQLLVVSPHEEYAYVSFDRLTPLAHDTMAALLTHYSGITTEPIPTNRALTSVLRSTGDNLRFRTELSSLATQTLEHVNEHWQVEAEQNISWQTRYYPDSIPATSAPGGILPSRLEWLCQPERIEHTLFLLFHLNYWAGARDQFLYADRQGLYQVKLAIMQRAHTLGALRAITYIDGTAAFARDFNIEMAIRIAQETFLEKLEDLRQSECELDNEKDQAALSLFQRIAGYEAALPGDISSLDEKYIVARMTEYLHALIEQARVSQQPIPTFELAALFLEPLDLLNIQINRNRTWLTWDELDESDLRKLDPEGLSMIAFQYESPTAHYVFHLPFRKAEALLPTRRVRELKLNPGHSAEQGSRNGQLLDPGESRRFAIHDILRELVVDISNICPYRLVSKEGKFRERTWNNYSWDDEGNYEPDSWVS